jgi:DNA (cytosine-5)-methyltransferase 1
VLKPQFILPLATELVIDLFAGGGGASTGIEQAIGRHVDIAVNHDPAAVSLHQANHPQTQHFVSDVFEVDPLEVTDGQPVGLLWASPDCKHFSKAKGGKPVSKKIRGLAWVVVKWAKLVRPRVICLENVEEFQTWGPLAEDGRPCPKRKGSTFQRWVAQLRNLGYVVEWRELRACDFGAPTIRKRLFLVARRDGAPIVWPEKTHGAGLKPYRTAAECIDWSLPCPSIFTRERPPAEATMRRIAHGVMRYVVNSPRPFIVPVTHQGDNRAHDSREPLRTVTSAKRGEFALCSPTIVGLAHGDHAERAGSRAHGAQEPVRTIHAGGGNHALVAAFLAKHYGGNEGPGVAVDGPASTITTQDHHHLVEARTAGQHRDKVHALLTKYYGTDQDPQLLEPLHTVTTKDRFGLVTVHGETYAIADIGMRMLQPRELFRAQGFPESYVIDRGADGRGLSKADQVRMCGNSVCPPLARAIVEANYVEREALREAA